jgi:hypothetical protein
MLRVLFFFWANRLSTVGSPCFNSNLVSSHSCSAGSDRYLEAFTRGKKARKISCIQYTCWVIVPLSVY